MQRFIHLIAVVLVGVIITGSGPASAVDKNIRIGWTAWSDAEAITRVTKRILETRMDYEVELVLLDIALQYNGVAKGDLDLMLMAWLPNTHADYWKRVKDDVKDLGILYSGASLGWVVPGYVPKNTLKAIPDLKKTAVRERLRGVIQGIDPGAGLMRLSHETINAYGLKGYSLVSSSGAAMTAALKRAIRRKDWIVVTGWRPHWMFGAFDLRYLQDPRGTLGGEERIHAIGRKGLSKDHAQLAEFISRIRMPLHELEELMYAAERTSYEKAAASYVKSHAKQVDYWLAGKR